MPTRQNGQSGQAPAFDPSQPYNAAPTPPAATLAPTPTPTAAPAPAGAAPASAAPAGAAPAFDPSQPYQKVQSDVEARHARSRNPNSNYGDTQNPGETGVAGVATGFGKSAAGLATGGAKFINKALPGSVQIPTTSNDLEPHGLAENVGAIGENMAEWAGGEEALKLGKVGALAKKYPEVIQLLETYPKAGRAILSMLGGAAQGGVHGEATGQAAQGAKGGAVGGLTGSVISDALPATLNKILRTTGFGGFNPTENLTKGAGGSVTVGTKNWQDSVQSVLPYLENKKFKSVGEFADSVQSTAENLWKQNIQPLIDQNKNVPIDTTGIRAAIQNSISDTAKEHFPEEAAEIERFANSFDKPKTVGQANSDILNFNARLKKFYRQSNDAQSATSKSDDMINAMETAVDELRNKVYTTVDPSGQHAADRTLYGKMKEVQRVFDKRATVADRQMPMNLPQMLALIAGGAEAVGAIAHGSPEAAVAGAVPIAAAAAAKHSNAPTTLINRAVEAGSSQPRVNQNVAQSAGHAIRSAISNPTVGAVTSTAARAGGAQIGEQANTLPPPAHGSIRVQLSDGRIADVHQDDFASLKARDPKLQVIH